MFQIDVFKNCPEEKYSLYIFLKLIFHISTEFRGKWEGEERELYFLLKHLWWADLNTLSPQKDLLNSLPWKPRNTPPGIWKMPLDKEVISYILNSQSPMN